MKTYIEKRINLILSIIVIGVLIVSSLMCKDQVTGSDIVFPPSQVSYHNHVEPLFLSKCAIPGGCHAGDTPAADLNLESYTGLRAKMGTVYIPGDTANSKLVWMIEGKPGYYRMPLNRSPLNNNQINGIKTWIMEGAQNN